MFNIVKTGDIGHENNFKLPNKKFSPNKNISC